MSFSVKNIILDYCKYFILLVHTNDIWCENNRCGGYYINPTRKQFAVVYDTFYLKFKNNGYCLLFSRGNLPTYGVICPQRTSKLDCIVPLSRKPLPKVNVYHLLTKICSMYYAVVWRIKQIYITTLDYILLKMNWQHLAPFDKTFLCK